MILNNWRYNRVGPKQGVAQRQHILIVVGITLAAVAVGGCRAEQGFRGAQTSGVEENQCLDAGWSRITLEAAGLQRQLLWKGPSGSWPRGAIIVLHGGGGKAAHFCGGGRLVGPQIRFAKRAIASGFAVFSLDSTNDQVTDANGRVCGKRFDFSVLNRPNLDLPYIQKVITQIIPNHRPPKSATAVFMAGLSTGGYMTIRAATHFDNSITAFAPISAGDPYGTDTNCDPALSPRKSAKGILLDRETHKQITQSDACLAPEYPNEKPWETTNPARKPAFKQFHHEADGIVDVSCMRKAANLLVRKGYPDRGVYLINQVGRKRALNHLWLDDYNEAILAFFQNELARGR